MARVEKDNKLRERIGKLESNIRNVEKEEKKEHRRGRWKLGCCGLFFLLILFCLATAAWGLTASGLVSIPAISNLAYRPPEPIHRVEAGLPLETYVSESFGSLLTERLQASDGVLTDRAVEISLPESSLTASFRDLLSSNDITWIDEESAQIAIEAGKGVELFLPLSGQTNNNALCLLVSLAAESGQIVLSAARLSVGNLTAPDWLSDAVLEPLLRRGLKTLNEAIGRYASIEKVEIRDSALFLSGILTVEVTNLD